MWASTLENLSSGVVKTQAQTSLRIQAVWSAPLFFQFLESIIYNLATDEILIF